MLSPLTKAGMGARQPQLQLTLVTRRRTRTFVLPPVAIAIFVGLLPLAGLSLLGAACYFIFHDDLLASLTKRQIAMQYDYEDHLARLRHEILTLTQRAKINEAELAERVGTLAKLQEALENRTVLVASLAERAQALRGASASVKLAPADILTPAPVSVASSTTARPAIPFETAKPQPDAFELRLDDKRPEPASPHSGPGVASPSPSPLSFVPDLPLATKLDDLADREARLGQMQLSLLNNLQKLARDLSARLRSALRATGLNPDRLALAAGKGRALAAEGGPFVPLPTDSTDGAAFAHAATQAQTAIATAERLHQIVAHVPLAAPLPGQLDVTSPFGPRLDPFLGRPALHTGVDLRDDYGAPVTATADGTVVAAGADGGYGNMVEIDHGNGLSTRYAHLSSIAVRLGQKVKAGTVVGRIGETGRATGPHLHYETRVDGQPVDPERFLKAGHLLRPPLSGPIL